MTEWYSRSEEEILRELSSSRRGLTEEEAAIRLEKYGENTIHEKPRLPWWQVFLEQFKDLLVVILIAAAAVSMVTGDPESAMVIFAVLFLNALLGTIQHEKAEKSLESLQKLSSPEARVVRNSQSLTIPSSQVVPGDVLILEAGDLAAADGRLLEVYGLTVNESSLTGESLSVEKHAGTLRTGNKERLSPGDQSNMVFSGSLITSGRALAVITATGMATEIGSIASLMNGAGSQKIPLQVSLDHFSGHLALGIMAVCSLVFGLSVCRKEPVLDALMFAVALAVAAIPEALSSIVTIVQAMGTQKMAKENAIIKDLKAVESLGCVSVICSDKTGTLTQNRMEVEQVFINGRNMEPEALAVPAAEGRSDVNLFLMAAALNNNASPSAREEEGDPAENALLHMVQAAGAIPEQLRLRCPRRGEIPFDSVRKRMTTVNCVGEEKILFVKGAVDVLLERCSRMANPAGSGAFGLQIPSRSLSASDRAAILNQNRLWSEQGLRILAFACRPVDESLPSPLSSSLVPDPESELIFLGMAAMMDPPRPESRSAVSAARQAGIRPVMITGDHRVTAMAIAGRIGIYSPGDLALTGAQLDHLTEEELLRELPRISVYARVSPEHKIRIVEAWQKLGHIVAMTGDGVNDAPALKKADIGIAMGLGGTEVSKEAASMILADDNFATIIKAAANGRNVYRNIKNAIQFLLSGNMAGILCVLYTSFAGLPLPFAPVHLLFINLITDSLPAIAIGMEPAEEDLLRRPPRDPGEGILTPGFVFQLLIQGGLMAAATMWSYRMGLRQGGEGTACTMAFSTLTLARLFHGFNCRSAHSIVALGLFTNPSSLMAFSLGAVLLAAVLFVPGLQTFFAAADLLPFQTAAVAAAAFLPTVVIQFIKILRETT